MDVYFLDWPGWSDTCYTSIVREEINTALLYKLLSEKLGNDTTEAMFKYIDNKTERPVEATIKTLATKDDFASVKYDRRKDMGEIKADTIK